MRADRVGASKDFLHFLGARIGCDIDVFRRLPADQIAHATAGEIGDVAGCAESFATSARAVIFPSAFSFSLVPIRVSRDYARCLARRDCRADRTATSQLDARKPALRKESCRGESVQTTLRKFGANRGRNKP